MKKTKQFNMNIPYRFVIILLFVLMNFTASASLLELSAGEKVNVNGYNFIITEINAGVGQGNMYVPFLNQWLPMAFSEVQVDGNGDLITGYFETAEITLPDFKNTEEAELFQMAAYGNTNHLPIALNNQPDLDYFDFGGHDCMLTKIRVTPNESWAEAVVIIHTPENQYLSFRNFNLPMLENGPEFCSSTFLFGNGNTTLNDPELPITIIGSMDPNEASRIEYSCNGFESFNLKASYTFPREQVIPADQNKNNAIATFNLIASTWGQFQAEINVDPFMIADADDIIFTLSNAWIDYDTNNNPDDMDLSGLPNDMQASYGENTWKGIYIATASVALPEGFAAADGSRFNINLRNFFYSKGDGVSGDLNVTPNLESNLEGWKIGLDTVRIHVVKNDPSIKLAGEINIPLMTESTHYSTNVMFEIPDDAPPPSPGQSPKKKMTMSLTLNLAGTYVAPMLKSAALTLYPGSVAGVKYRDGKFQPYANLSGNFGVSISKPEVNLPTLEFSNLKINDFSIPSTPPNGVKTGGLDKISIGAFGFGGPSFTSLGSGNAAEALTNTSGPGTPPTSNASPAEVPGNQKKMAGFPIQISEINFGSTTYDDTSCYKLSFDISLNFAKGVNTFNASGSFGILAALNFKNLISDAPWEALKYKTTIVEGIGVNAKLGAVTIKGGLALFNNDAGGTPIPDYGEGFKGAFTMSIEKVCSVEAVAQFGTTTFQATNNGDKYRYFLVDAMATFGKGIVMAPPIPISLYGFGGGLYYNMSRQDISAAAGADGMAGLGSTNNSGQDAKMKLGDDLLTPGKTLSPGTYIPKEGIVGLKATAILGLSAPETLMLETTFGIEIDYTDFSPVKMTFDGTGYVGSESVEQRRQAAIQATISLSYELSTSILQGTFGASVKYPKNNPMIEGSYVFNENGLGKPCNFYFNPNEKWWIMIGGPNNRLTTKFTPGGLNVGSVESYFMLGSELPGLPEISTVLHWPSELKSLFPATSRDFGSVLSGGSGIAFGMKAEIPEKSYKFLAFYASFSAGMGFDVSMINFSKLKEQLKGCGDDENSFGMNYWYLQGQAYGYFQGAVGVHVDLWFYEGNVKLLSLTAGAVLQVKAPNPTYLKAYIAANYRALGGAIKGRFNFKVEMGRACEAFDQFAGGPFGLPIIGDIFPDDDEELEVYDNPSVYFNFSANTAIDFMRDDDGVAVPEAYRLKVVDAKVTKKGRSVKVPGMNFKWDAEQQLLTLEQSEIFDENSDYEFEVTVGWDKRVGNTWQNVTGASETRIVEFKTKDRPSKIMESMVKYHAPGKLQRYWTKNYAEPKLEFKTSGYEYLFNPIKEIENKSSGSYWAWLPSQSTSISGDGPYEWVSVPFPSYQIEVPVTYKFRLTNLHTDEIQVRDLTSYPGLAAFENAEIKYKSVSNGNVEVVMVPYLAITNTTDTKVDFSKLNDSDIELVKGDVYKLEILRVPTESPQAPIHSVSLNSNNTTVASSNSNDNSLMTILENTPLVNGANTQAGTNSIIAEGGTVTTEGVDLSTAYSLETSVGVIENTASGINDERYETEILYSYHFGVSRYNSLKEKVEAYTHEQTSVQLLYCGGWNYPENNTSLQFRESNMEGGNYNKIDVLMQSRNHNKRENFDLIDNIRLRAVFYDLDYYNHHPYADNGLYKYSKYDNYRNALPTWDYDRNQVKKNNQGISYKDGWAWDHSASVYISQSVWTNYVRVATAKYYTIPRWGSNLSYRYIGYNEKGPQLLTVDYTNEDEIHYGNPLIDFSQGTWRWSDFKIQVESQQERILMMQENIIRKYSTMIASDYKFNLFNTFNSERWKSYVPYDMHNLLKRYATYNYYNESGGLRYPQHWEPYVQLSQGVLKNRSFKWGLKLDGPVPEYFHSNNGGSSSIKIFTLPNYNSLLGY
ncbi:MAG: hypothetical protein ACI9FN_001009 [Saprospiraceae bacterium]|jgi:hypothetical protein